MAEFNQDELNAPSWMNIEFLEKVLRSSENCNDVKIIQYEIFPATQKGDHFASIMFRASVKFSVKSEEKDISIIIKTMPVDDGKKKDMLKSLKLFETESRMYMGVIPKFHSILREHGDDSLLGPRMLYNSLSPIKVIVLEDITKTGFQMIGKQYANFDLLQMILGKLSKWHAISFKLLKENDNCLLEFNEGFFNSCAKSFAEFYSTGFELFGETLASLPNGKVLKDKFDNIQGKLLQKCHETSSNVGNLCVLNHGDFHRKNMMFKWGTNKTDLQDMIPLDFQLCVVAPPIIDLYYILTMVIEPKVRLQRSTDVISMYHKKFVDTLRMLKFNGSIPSLEDIQDEMLKHKHLELVMIATMLPLTLGLMSSNKAVPENILTSKSAKAEFYKCKAYINELEIVLPKILEKGYFNNF